MAGEHVWNDFIGAFLRLFQQDRFAREDKIDEADGGSAGHLQRKRKEQTEERKEEEDKPLTGLWRDLPIVYSQALPPHLASFPAPGQLSIAYSTEKRSRGEPGNEATPHLHVHVKN